MSNNYLNNEEIYIEICIWKLAIYAFDDTNIKPSNKIGEAIRLTTEGLSNHSKFYMYTWKEDMVANGIESMIKGLFNFNEQRYSNPHGYMSMSAENAFLQTIEKEERELLSTYKTFLVNHRDEFESMGLISSTIDEQFVQNMVDRVKNIENGIERKKKRRKLLKLKRELSPMAKFIYGDDIVDEIDERIKETETFYTSRDINYGERGKLLISVQEIKDKLGIKMGSICVGDVIEFLKDHRQMEIDEGMRMGSSEVEISFLEFDNNDFVSVVWS